MATQFVPVRDGSDDSYMFIDCRVQVCLGAFKVSVCIVRSQINSGSPHHGAVIIVVQDHNITVLPVGSGIYTISVTY